MADTKQTKSKATKETGDLKFNFCCGDSEEMSRMMQNFCKSEDGIFDCEKMMQMMQKMCCTVPEKTGRQ